MHTQYTAQVQKFTVEVKSEKTSGINSEANDSVEQVQEFVTSEKASPVQEVVVEVTSIEGTKVEDLKRTQFKDVVESNRQFAAEQLLDRPEQVQVRQPSAEKQLSRAIKSVGSAEVVQVRDSAQASALTATRQVENFNVAVEVNVEDMSRRYTGLGSSRG